jgi:hypothetical protein
VDPASLSAIGDIVVPTVSVVVCGGFGLICFPSIRAAFAERLRSRALRHADATDVVSQLSALRGEVYALRVELAEVKRAVGAGPSPHDPALPPGRERG